MAEILFVLRTSIGVIFVWAAGSKIRGLEQFVKTIELLRIPAGLTRTVAFVVPTLEASVGMALVFGLVPEASAAVALSLLLTFIIVSIWTKRQRLTVPCRCFGESATVLGRATALQAAIVAVAALSYVIGTHYSSGTGWPTTLETAVAAGTAVAGLVLLFRWLLAVSEVGLVKRERSSNMGLYTEKPGVSL